MNMENELGKGTIRPALLIIDVQNRYIPSIPPRDKEVAFYFINMLINLFRKPDLPILRIYHHNPAEGPRPGTEEFEYPSALAIKPEDVQIVKTYPDAFNKTSLNEELKRAGSNTLFLCGLSAVGCVMATRTGAQNHDFKVFMVKDAIMSHNTEYTRNVEVMFNAVGLDMVELVVEGA
jgi:Isochorismate hydrolase